VWTFLPDLGTTAGQTAAMQWIETNPARGLRHEPVDYMQTEEVKAWLERQRQVP
jgi:hypothetical protein